MTPPDRGTAARGSRAPRPRTATHVAAKRGDISIVRVLAEHAKFHEQDLKDKKGRTPVDLCAQAAAPCRELPDLMKKAIHEAAPDAAPMAAASAFDDMRIEKLGDAHGA